MINRILVVNDNHLERQIINNALKNTYLIEEAENGLQALEMMKTFDFDIVILDNVLEHETGYDIARDIREHKKFDNIHLLLMSSNKSSIDELEAFEAGFSAYLVKEGMNQKILSLVQSFEKKQLRSPTKILIVDDSKTIRAMLANTFNKEGFTVKTVESGEQCIRIVKEFKPEYITMDVEMPGMNGFQTSKVLRSMPECAEVPIFIISGIDSHEARVKAIESGISEYYLKPFPPQRLVEHIKNLKNTVKNKKGKNLLAVGFSNPVKHIVHYTLSNNGYQIMTNEKSDDILSFMDKNPIDLILLDYNSSNENDVNLLHDLYVKIKNENKNIPIISVYDETDKYAKFSSYANGADDIIGFPFSEIELLKRVTTTMDCRNKIEKNDDEIIIEL